MTGGGRARGSPGFTLIEVLVALWILGVALLAGMALLLQQPRVVRRIDAERQAVRCMEWTLESIRAGVLPLQTEVVQKFVNSGNPGVAAPDLAVAVTVTPAAAATGNDLYEVSLVATYTVYGQHEQRRMDTLVWRPGSGGGP